MKEKIGIFWVVRQLSTKQKIHRFYPKCAAVTSQRRPVQAAPEAPAARSSVAENLSQRKVRYFPPNPPFFSMHDFIIDLSIYFQIDQDAP